MTKVYYTNYTDTKKQSQAGRALLDFVLREYYGILSYEVRLTDTGKPYIEGDPVFFSISHSGGVVTIALSDGEVGVDTEPIRDIRPALIKRYFGVEPSSGEEALRLWLQRESYGKMTGEGFAVSEPFIPHAFHHFEIRIADKLHYICVCTADSDVLTPCFVPLP